MSTASDSEANVSVHRGAATGTSMNRSDELFGESRIVESIAANRHSCAREIFQALRRSVEKFVENGLQQDDMTGIVVKVLD